MDCPRPIQSLNRPGRVDVFIAKVRLGDKAMCSTCISMPDMVLTIDLHRLRSLHRLR